MKAMNSSASRIDEFDGLRGILASWVALAHIFCWCGFAGLAGATIWSGAWSEFVYAGAAVQAFIILSGFAISYLLHAKKQTYGPFLLGRFFRIYPVYVICLALAAVTLSLKPLILQAASWGNDPYFDPLKAVYPSESQHLVPHLLAHLTLLNGIIPTGVLMHASGSILPPAWSITLEWQYYLLAPFIALWLRSRTGLLALAAASLLGIKAGHMLCGSTSAFLPPQLPLFLLGIASYHIYTYFAPKQTDRSVRFILPIPALIAGALILYIYPVVGVIWALVFGCLFAQKSGYLRGFLNAVRGVLLHPALQHLGRISYPLYLVHWPTILFCLALLLRWKPDLTPVQALVGLLVIGVPVILLLAEALHRFVEAPAMKFGRGPRAAPEMVAPVIPDERPV